MRSCCLQKRTAIIPNGVLDDLLLFLLNARREDIIEDGPPLQPQQIRRAENEPTSYPDVKASLRTSNLGENRPLYLQAGRLTRAKESS